jgi:hypothetical protein
MKIKQKIKQSTSVLLFLGSLATSSMSFANTADIQHIQAYDTKKADAAIITLYKTLPGLSSHEMSQRIAAVSEYFLGQPYVLGALGEGEKSNYDQNPLYRTDAFDCVTYVNTVLAIAFGKNLQGFKGHLLALNYMNGVPVFAERNHFMSVDWNKNNAKKAYVNDITYKIIDRDGIPIAQIADTIIDKPTWFRTLKASQIKRLDIPGSELSQQLQNALHEEGKKTHQEKSVMLYLPINRLINTKGEANAFILSQIPSGSIIEIVRPNWPVKNKIGTNMNVSHLGFAIRTEQGLMFREASQLENKVIDVPLATYLKNYLHSETVKGINVQEVIKNF